jgi:hypothetical protein
MDNTQKFSQLSDEIDALESWVVDHPNADYFAKMEVVTKWIAKTDERQTLIQDELNNLRKNTFKTN